MAGGSAAGQIGKLTLPHFRLLNIYYIPNRFFIPNITKLPSQGETVNWLMLNPGNHGIFDASGMELFGDRVMRVGQTYSFTFTGAGTFGYDDPLAASHKGKVQVPITVALVVGAVGMAQVTWASAAPPAGFGFDVQVQPPGSTDWVDWLTGVTGQTVVFGPNSPLWAGPGTYRFRAGMVNTVNGTTSGYSPAKGIALS